MGDDERTAQRREGFLSAIGTHAAKLLVQRCRGETVNERIIDVGFSIVERASTMS